MALFFHSTASLVIAECPSLILTQFNDVPYLVCVDPKYLKWTTSSNTFPFIHMLVHSLGLMLLTRILPLLEPISIPYPEAAFSSLSVNCCSSSSLPPRRLMSSANHCCNVAVLRWTLMTVRCHNFFCIFI